MGRSQKRLREDLRFVGEFRTLCDVMQQAAVSQLVRSDGIVAGAPRVLQFLARECLPMLPASAASHPLLRRGQPPFDQKGGRPLLPGDRRTIVLMTSDDGLVGPLHTLTARRAMSLAGPNASWVLVGQRAARLVGGSLQRVRQMPWPSDDTAETKWRRLAEILLDEYRRGVMTEAVLVAPRYLSRTRQEPAVYPLLPLPAEGLGSALRPGESLIVEPSLDQVVEALALMWMTASGLEAQALAHRAEHAARILHMERARDELATSAKQLRYDLFKTMHTRVDVMVRETCVVQRLAEARRRAAKAAG